MQDVTGNQPQGSWGTTQIYGMAGGATSLPEFSSGDLRVGILSPVLYLGGVEIHMLGLMKYCRKVAWTGCAVTGSLDARMASQVSNYCSVGTGVLSVRGLMEISDAIIVWGNSNAAQLLKGFKGKVIFVAHGVSDWTRRMAAGLCSLADEVVCVSYSSRNCLPPDVRARARVLLNGVDRSRLLVTDSKERLRRKWAIPFGVPVVGYIGRFSSEKGYLGAALVAKKIGGHALYMGRACGIADAEDRVRVAAGGAVTFVSPWANPGDALSVMDCLVANGEEGFGLAIAEAWLAGVPVVSSRSGIAGDLSDAMWTGVIVSTYANNDDLAQAAIEAMECSQNGKCVELRKFAENHLTADLMGHRWDMLFDEMNGQAINRDPKGVALCLT